MDEKIFTRHHIHSVYSTRDGMLKVKDLFDKAEANNETFSITDHGSIGAWLSILDEAKGRGITPILGIEAYMNPNRDELFAILEEIEMLKKAEPEIAEVEINEEEMDAKALKKAKSDAKKAKTEAKSDAKIKLDALKERRAKLEKYEHLVILARNELGARNIIKLNNMAYTHGFYRKPMISHDELFNKVDFDKNGDDGLLITTACLGSGINRMLLTGDYTGAKSVAESFKKRFKDNYMIEVQSNKIPEQIIVNKEAIKLADELGIQLCIGIDAHYLDPEDADTHQDLLLLQNKNKRSDMDAKEPYITVKNILGVEKQTKVKNNEYKKLPYDQIKIGQVIGTGKTAVTVIAKEEKSKVWSYATDIVYYKSEKEIRKEVKEYHPELAARIGDIIKGNYLISAKCNKIELDASVKLPHVENSSNVLKIEVAKGLKEKKLTSKEAIERAKFELDIIIKSGFEDYFLILSDIMRYAKSIGTPLGAARGSAGACLVAHLLDIHRINPLEERWGPMNFGRFLDLSRNKDKIVLHGDTESIEMIEDDKVIIKRDNAEIVVKASEVKQGDIFIKKDGK